ncbi:MAG: DUF5606 domain-containing protein [Paludibacter sp.]|nr:DUF5606 domain-containing protein [Paludibacter sp.]
MLKEILSISGKSGLFKLVSRAKNMLIVESLLDGKRSPAYTTEKVMPLSDIAIYTQDAEIRLNEVLKKLYSKEEGKMCIVDPKSDNQTLQNFMGELVPDFNRDRVYPSDIRKLIIWYNILINAGITDFEVEIEKEDDNSQNSEKKDIESVEVKEKVQPKKSAVKQTVKIQEKKVKTPKQTHTKV